MKRRDFLKGAGTAVAASVAGCGGKGDNGNNNGDGEGQPDPTSTGKGTVTATGTPTATEAPPVLKVVENQEIEIPFQTDFSDIEKISDEQKTKLKVNDEDDEIEKAALFLEPPEEENKQPEKIKESKGDTLEVAVTQLEPGKHNYHAKVHTKNGEENVTEPVTLTKNTPDAYRADIKTENTPPGQHQQSYQTIYSFDDLHFDQKQLNTRRQRWLEDDAFNGFITKVKADMDMNTHVSYPKSPKYKPGVFQKEEFLNTEEFKPMLKWIVPAAKEQGFINGYASEGADRMAATAEIAIDQLHDANVRAWPIYNPGHGSMLFYHEDQEKYLHADTTMDAIRKPENALSHREDIWSPFRSKDAEKQPGFQPGDMPYDQIPGLGGHNQKKRVAKAALQNMVSHAINKSGVYRKTFITDIWMDEAYEHIRNGKPIEPILNPLEEMVETQIETGNYVGLYGTLDDTRTPSGPDLENVYDKVMNDPEPVTTQMMENQLLPNAAG